MALFKTNQISDAAKHFHLCILNKDEAAYGPPLAQIQGGVPFHCIAFCYARLGRTDDAAQAFQHAVALSPDDKGMLIDLARFALHISRPGIAQPAFERWTREHPDDVDAREVLETIRQSCLH
jgi:predicted Zn-dependent protease